MSWPPPLPRKTNQGDQLPLSPDFSGFVFKIQANMDPRAPGPDRLLRVAPAGTDWEGNRQTVQDRDGLPLVLFRDD